MVVLPFIFRCHRRRIPRRRPGPALVVPLLFAAPSSPGQNFPPVARAAAEPAEAWVDEAVSFSSEGSFDPDRGPEALRFSWEFGDGSGSAEAAPAMAFGEPGAYAVTLTVSDGAATSVATLTVHVLAPPAPGRPGASRPLVLSPGGGALWVANPDSSTVTVLDLTVSPPVKAAEIEVGPSPRTMALSGDGRHAFVACQGRNALWVLDAAGRRVLRRVAVGHRPYGVAVSPGDGRILVSNQGDGTVSVIRRADLAVVRVLPVGGSPRAIAVTAGGERAYVSHLITRGAEGRVTEIDLATLETRSIALVEDPGPDTPSSGRGVPNLLSALAVEPSGRSIWIGGLKSNSGRGTFKTGDPLLPENTVRGFFGRIDAAGGAEVVGRRIDINNGDRVSAIAFSPNGRYAYVTHPGAGALSVYDLSAATLVEPGDGAPVPVAARVDVGHAPHGVTLTADGSRAFVANSLSRDVTVLDLADPADPVVEATVGATAEPLSPRLANGKRLFHRSRGPVHSRGNYIACASCHPDGGGNDGRTWDFTGRGEGLRNTIDLRGRGGTAHGPVHWSANFDEIQDFENDIINAFGGTGLAADGSPPNPPLGAPNAGRSADLDDLAAYVASLAAPPPSPYRHYDGSLTPAARRGRTVFFDPAVGCADCHPPPRFTDSTLEGGGGPGGFVLHDVGTLTDGSGQRLGGRLPGLDAPSLLGLWASPPYLHDGSAQALSDVLTTRNPEGRHGTTAGLAPGQIDDLVAYLLSLDGTPGEGGSAPPSDRDGDGLPDTWEVSFDLDPDNGDDAGADADGDGQANRAEFVAGTDPQEPFSHLRATVDRPGRDGGAATLSFPTAKGVRYAVESSPTLAPPAWEGIGVLEGDGATVVFSDRPRPDDTVFFYRVRVIPPPAERQP